MSLGFENAGCQILGGIECEAWPFETHKANFPDCMVNQDEPIDIKDLGPLDLGLKPGSVDILIGGLPCQGFSIVGQSKIRSLGIERERDKKNKLYQEFVRFLDYFRPLYFVIENVSGMKMFKKQRFLDQIIEELKAVGYDVDKRILCASDFGVPQIRNRLFIIGRRKDRPDLAIRFPEPLTGECVTVRDAISDLRILKAKKLKTKKGTLGNGGVAHENKPVTYKTSKPVSTYQKKMRSGNGPTVLNHVCRGHNEVDLKIFGKLRQGGKYIDLPAKDRRYRDDIFKDKYRRLDNSKPSWTLTAHMQRDCLAYIHPTQTRSISTREAARLQSFPDRFVFAGPLTKVFRQIGNAVPPLLAEHLAGEIVSELSRGDGKECTNG